MIPALVIIDMQKWFFRSDDRRENLSGLIESINELIDVATAKKIPVFQVLTIHKADKSTWNIVMKKHNISALLEGSDGAKLLPDIKFNSSQEVVVKTRQSTFIRTNFEEQLKGKNIDTLIIGGVFTHGCVGRTAVDAYERDFNVILAKDASFSHMKNQEKSMLEVIEEEQEQLALKNKEIIDYLNSNII